MTRYGCRTGIPSRGTSCATGKPARPRPPVGGAQGRNVANPRTGCGMQQARGPRCGGSRRSGAKPQGRNATSGVAPPEPKRQVAPDAGVDASRVCRWRGERCAFRFNWPGCADGNPGEKVIRPGRSVQLRRGAKTRKVRIDMVPRDSVGRPAHGIPRGSVRGLLSTAQAVVSQTPGQDRGGGGKGQRPATGALRATAACRKTGGVPRTLKVTSTSRKPRAGYSAAPLAPQC